MATIKTLTITLGEESHRPFEYESFKVGPISVEVTLDQGETVKEVSDRIREALQPVWDDLFIMQRNKFHEHRALRG